MLIKRIKVIFWILVFYDFINVQTYLKKFNIMWLVSDSQQGIMIGQYDRKKLLKACHIKTANKHKVGAFK